jgi:hypothetical protein
MKTGPRADYPITVSDQTLEEEPPASVLYSGIYTMYLNFSVRVAFIPDMSALAPPWDASRLPDNFDLITTPDQARLATALRTWYVVTPNEARGGQVERFHPFDRTSEQPTVVRFVHPSEFAQFAADLDELSELVGGVYTDKTVVDLQQYSVVRFVAEHVVGAGLMDPRDAYWLTPRPSTSGPA